MEPKVFRWKPLPPGWCAPLPLIPAAPWAGSGPARNTGAAVPHHPHTSVLV